MPGQPNLREIREDLEAILDEARGATFDGPWDVRSLRYKRCQYAAAAFPDGSSPSAQSAPAPFAPHPRNFSRVEE